MAFLLKSFSLFLIWSLQNTAMNLELIADNLEQDTTGRNKPYRNSYSPMSLKKISPHLSLPKLRHTVYEGKESVSIPNNVFKSK